MLCASYKLEMPVTVKLSIKTAQVIIVSTTICYHLKSTIVMDELFAQQ